MHITACEVVRLELVDVEVDAGFGRGDEGANHARRDHLAQAHADEVAETHMHTR